MTSHSHRMEGSTQNRPEMQQALLPESTVLLNSAADIGNWELVKDLISSGDVSDTDIQQSFLLKKLASTTEVSDQLVIEILKKIASPQTRMERMKSVAQDAVLHAAKTDKWNVVMAFLSTCKLEVDDGKNLLSLLQTMTNSDNLTKRRHLHIDVLTEVWRHSKQKILDSTNTEVTNMFVQLAAKLSMWSRVCDTLVAMPDLNGLDRDGLSVLHRLVLCTDSRFDSILPALLANGADVNIRSSRGETVLHLAAKHQHLERLVAASNTADTVNEKQSSIVKEHRIQCVAAKHHSLASLINSSCSLDGCDGLGNTAVILAAKNENWEFLRLLLEHGARAACVDVYQRSVLHVLALTGSSMNDTMCQTLVTLCVNGGAEVNSTDADECSPLHLAVQSKNWMLFKQLLDIGANCEAIDNDGYKVLHRLAMTDTKCSDDLMLLFSLVSLQGVDLNSLSRKGFSALHIAATLQNWTLVKHLAQLGANVHLYNVGGYTVLHLVAMTTHSRQSPDTGLLSDQWEDARIQELSVLHLLIEKGADLRLRCSSGDTVLHLAAKHKNWQIVDYLIQRGANILELDSEGIPLIQRLVRCKAWSHETLNLFRRLHENVGARNAQISAGDSLLQLAAKHDNWNIVDHILRNQGGNVDEPDSEGFNILQRMATSRSETFQKGWNCSYVTVVLRKSRDFDKHRLNFLIHRAAAAGNIDVVDVLVDNFDDVNATDCEGFTVLHRMAQCCQSASVAIIRRLVEKGAILNKRCFGGNTALHIAAKSNNWLAVQHLLKYEANVDSLDNDGMSVLHRLLSQPWLECPLCVQSPSAKSPVYLLAAILSKGALVNQKDPHGNTPLHLAVKHEHWDMAMELVARGASLTERDSSGFTALHVLAKRRLRDALSALNQAPIQSGNNSKSCNATREDPLETKCVTCSIDRDPEAHLLCASLGNNKSDHLVVCDCFCENATLIHALDLEGNTAILLSARHNNWDIGERLLLNGANPCLPDENIFSFLHLLGAVNPTCNYDFSDDGILKKILELVISRGVDVTAQDPEGNTPVQLAAKHGNMEMVERLLDFSMNVNEADSEGFTLLSRVAQTASPKSAAIARRLLQEDADVNITCADDMTPLLLSVLSRNWNIVSLLWDLTSSRNIDVVLQKQPLILHHVIEDDCDQTWLWKLHWGNWRRILNIATQRNLDGTSVLQMALLHKKWDLAAKCILHDAHTDIEAVAGDSVFHVLARMNRSTIANLMPHRQLNINLRDENGDTPINVLAKTSNWHAVKQFSEHGADVNMPDRDGWTAIHKLAMTSHWNYRLECLVECGADINMVGRDGKTAVMLALSERNWSEFWQLIKLGARFDWIEADKRLLLKNIYHFSINNDQLEQLSEIIKNLIRSSFNSSSCDRKSHQLKEIFKACVLNSNWAVAKVLLQCEPEIDIQTLADRTHLLHKMVSLYSHGDHVMWVSLLDTLVESGLDINCRDLYGQTALMKRRVLKNLDNVNNYLSALFNILLDKGVRPSAVDDEGRTILTKVLAIYRFKSLRIVKNLLEQGLIAVSPQPQDFVQSDGLQVPVTDFIFQMERALIKVNSSVVKILVECGALSNSVLSGLNIRHQLEKTQDADSDTEGDDFGEILEKASSHPRSLESLCRVAVSRAIPYGLNRRYMVMSLPIPSVLKDYLLYTDVMSDLSDIHSDAQDEDSDESDNSDTDDYETSADEYDDPDGYWSCDDSEEEEAQETEEDEEESEEDNDHECDDEDDEEHDSMTDNDKTNDDDDEHDVSQEEDDNGSD